MNELIDCKTCKKPIACVAEICPSCGAPNDWLHPDVAHFLAVQGKISVSKPFNFWHTKTTITGRTEASAPLWALLVAAFLGCAGVLMFLVFGFISAVVVFFFVFLLLLATKRYQHFSADVVSRTWSSSNDRLWSPIKATLKL
ncbi:MAG: hypothetical protein ACKVOT_14185 [Polaromonas sp.]